MGTPSAPNAPNPAKSYEQEIAIYLQNLPKLLQAEQDARTTYDPQRIAEQQGLQSQYGPTQYSQQLDALHQLDPTGTGIRDQLGSSVSSGLSSPENQGLYQDIGSQVKSQLDSGYALPKDLESQLEQQIRGAQVARGNVYGDANVSAEGLFKGQNAINFYQQRLGNAEGYLNLTSPTQKAQDNAGQFLGLSTPEQQIGQIQPVQADQSSAYTNPSAGFAGQNFALSNYGNQLGQYNAQTAQGNPWARALSGAASGAAAGSAGGTWGTVIGAAAGAAGGYFSDSRLKENIHKIAKLPNGLPLVRFNFKGQARKIIGVLAQNVVRLFPEAISFGVLNGKVYATVNYAMIGAPILEVTNA